MNDTIIDQSYVNDADRDSVISFLDDGNYKALGYYINNMPPVKAAQLVQSFPNDKREIMLTNMLGFINPEILTWLDDTILSDFFSSVELYDIAPLLDRLESDDAVEMLELINEDRLPKLLTHIPAQDRALFEYSLQLPDECAGRIMRREVVTAPSFWTAGQMIDYLRNPVTETPTIFYSIILVGSNHKPVGVVLLDKLLRSSRTLPLMSIKRNNAHNINVLTPQEDVADYFRNNNLVEAPVTDEEGHVIGSITIDDIVDVIDEAHEDDLLKMGGVSEDDFYEDIISTSWSRITWLMLNLATAIVASIVIAFFDKSLEQVVALAILMPIVASMGGNAGTQTMTVAVRAIATKNLTRYNYWSLLNKEIFVSLINGIILAIISAIIAYMWFSSISIAVTIAVAMVINLFMAALAGIIVPVSLQKYNYDPAIASGVFVTTVTDIIGFVAFLGMASFIVL